MIRLARLAVLPMVAGAALLGVGPVGAVAAADTPSCNVGMSWNYTKASVQCDAGVPGNRFRAVGYCAGGAVHYGPWVFQGPGHVSVVTCSTGVNVWDKELAY